MDIRCTMYIKSRAMLYTMDDRNKRKKIYYTCAAAATNGWWVCAVLRFRCDWQKRRKTRVQSR